jgi:Tfp pilus assembly protein PilF
VSSRLGQSEEATEFLHEWLDDNPDDGRVLQFLGEAYQNTGQEKRAIQTYEKALGADPDNVVVLNNLAWLYSQAKDPKALELAERAYKTSPKDGGVQDTYGWILVQQGQVDKGRRILEQAMEQLSEVPEVQYHYAVALLNSGEKIAARKILQKLLDEEKTFEGRDDAIRLLQ